MDQPAPRSSADVAAAADRVRNQIADAGGDPERITLLAVTKGHGPWAMRAAFDAGLAIVGESYAQELLAKLDDPLLTERPEGAEIHFIGALQSRKIRQVAEHVALWHSIDRASLVDELAKRSPGARLLVQVNASGEASKSGAAPADVAALVARARRAGLDVEGLMTIGVLDDSAATAAAFHVTARLADELGLPTRSMGMSADLAEAVAAGTTMIRVGTALFGPRPPRDG